MKYFLNRLKYIAKYKNKFDFAASFATYSISASFVSRIASKNTALWGHADYLTLFENDEQKMKEFFKNRKYNKFKHIIFVSEEGKNSFIKVFPKMKDKTIVCNNLIDGEKIKKLAEEKIELNKEKTITTFINVGRHDEKQKKYQESINDRSNLESIINEISDAPRYGDLSKRKYYAEDGSAIDSFIAPKEGEETKELLKEDYGEPGAVEYMLEKKGAENLDFSNAKALKANPYLRDVDINLIRSMTEEERKMLYASISEYTGNDKNDREMRVRIDYGMSLVVSDRVKEETLANIEKYGNDYLVKISYEDNLYRYLEGFFQTGRVMGTNFNPFYKRGQSAALERLKHEGTEEQKIIIYGFEGIADIMTDSCINAGNKTFPLIGKFEAYNIAWGKSYSHSLNYDYYDLDISIKEAQDKAFYDANKSLALGMMPDVADAWVKYNISDNLLTYLNQIDYMDMKTIFKQYGIDIGKDTLWSTVVNANNKINEYMANEEKDNKK